MELIENLMKNINGSTNKLLALVVMTIVTLGMVTVFVVDSIVGRQVPDVISGFVYTILGSVVGYSVHALGVDNGLNATKEAVTAITDSSTGKLPIVIGGHSGESTNASETGVDTKV